ncbi:RHS repeat-associated core domain-containing protein [Massilia sp. DWR3-1-1]|uniref:RHS repeat-associated core domain-containing protein n=1 Tax=Massilia sp. DWR3-1-1 TaxID=2804559 RepID=UPI003CFA11D6
MPRARTRAKIASRKKFALYTPSAREKPRQVIEGTKENGRAYDRFGSGGRFLSVDPVVTDANTGSSFNLYAYANNNPFGFVDPDGRDGIGAFGEPEVGVGNICKAMCRRVRANIVQIVVCLVCMANDKRPPPPPPKPPLSQKPVPGGPQPGGDPKPPEPKRPETASPSPEQGPGGTAPQPTSGPTSVPKPPEPPPPPPKAEHLPN